MDWAVVVARVLLALPLLVFGLDGLLEFLPRDFYPEHGEQATLFLEALVGSRYAWELLKIVEILIATALLTGRFVPVALVAFAPVLVNILGFHLTLEREGLGLAIWLLFLASFLAWAYRAHFVALVDPNAKPFSGPPQ